MPCIPLLSEPNGHTTGGHANLGFTTEFSPGSPSSDYSLCLLFLRARSEASPPSVCRSACLLSVFPGNWSLLYPGRNERVHAHRAACIHIQINVEMCGWRYGNTHIYRWTKRQTDKWADGWMGGYLEEWMSRMDGSMPPSLSGSWWRGGGGIQS